MVQPDRHTIVQILGGLMNKPEILSESDKYLLEPSDFNLQLDKFIFTAIYNLFINGAKKISAVDIGSYLESNTTAKKLLEKENGEIFLQDCEVNSEPENFYYYYNKLKKLNILRDIQRTGRDTEFLYCEDITNPNYNKINNKFENMTVRDIVEILKLETLNLEKKYVLNNGYEEGSPADSIRERLQEWKEKPEVGCALQGEIYNTITRGGRKGKLYLRSMPSGLGKTRNAVGDACYIAYPIRYEPAKGKWVSTGPCEKVCYIMTEQETYEIDTMIMAYLTGYNEDVFLYGTFDINDPIIQAAAEIIEKYKDNFDYVQIPDPSASIIKNVLRQKNWQKGIENFFYDYIFSSPAMLSEYRDLKLREDKLKTMSSK